MGGRSSSRNQETINIDNSTRQDFTNQSGAGLAVDGSGNTISVVDGGAFEFGSEALAQAFEFGSDSVDSAYSVSRAVIDSQREASRNTLDKSVQLAQGAIAESANNNARAFQFAQGVASPGGVTVDNFKYLAIAATVVGAALILKGKK